MKTFKQLISENTTVAPAPASEITHSGPLKHLTHNEDLAALHGHAGAEHAINVLEHTHKRLSGENSDVTLTTKYDGAPSVIFGRMPRGHPRAGQYFVSTKSAFNEKPKINYAPEDIVQNHGHAPGLVEKLNAALEHIPKLGLKHGDIYQGDVMYTKPDVRDDGKKFSFTPNTLTYSTDKNSEEGKKISNAKIGIAVHTKYEGEGEDISKYVPGFNPNLKKLTPHPDIHIISSEVKSNPENYTDLQKSEFLKHISMAKDAHDSLDEKAHSILQPHLSVLKDTKIENEPVPQRVLDENFSTYINSVSMNNGVPNTQDFIQHIKNREEKKIARLSQKNAIERKQQLLAAKLADIKRNKQHFDKLFQLHKHLQNAKNALVPATNTNSSTLYSASFQGIPESHEGTVAIHSKTGLPTKIVKRDEFSRRNRESGKYTKQPSPEQ